MLWGTDTVFTALSSTSITQTGITTQTINTAFGQWCINTCLQTQTGAQKDIYTQTQAHFPAYAGMNSLLCCRAQISWLWRRLWLFLTKWPPAEELSAVKSVDRAYQWIIILLSGLSLLTWASKSAIKEDNCF